MNWFARIVSRSGTGSGFGNHKGLRKAIWVPLWLLLCLGLPLDSAAQAANAVAISGGPILTPYGTPAGNAPVYVCAITAIGTPCSTSGVTLYSDPNLTTPIANPTSTNSQGIYAFFTTTGIYQVQVQATSTATYTYYVSPGGGSSGLSGSGTADYATMWTGTSGLGNAQSTDGTANIQYGIGTSSLTPNLNLGANGNFNVNSSGSGSADFNLGNTSGAFDVSAGSGGVDFTTQNNGSFQVDLSGSGSVSVNANNGSGSISLNAGTGGVAVNSNGTVFLNAGTGVGNFYVNGNNPVTAKTIAGTNAPTDTCSSTVNTFAIEVNATPTAYQCSNATGSYAWSTMVNLAGYQTNLNLTAGTYVNGDLCTYTASGTVLNCNTAMPTSLPPSGSAGGDLFGSYPSPTVVRINGAAVPASATVLGSNSSSQPIAAATTGSGNVVLATSPALVTPNLGTPSAVTLTNGTGLPLTTGVTGVLPLANGGTGTTNPSLVAGTNITISGAWPDQTITASSTGATAFSALTSSTNTQAAMLVGTGASLAPTGTGTITGTGLAGSPTSGQYWGYNGTAQGWYTVSAGGVTLQTNGTANSSQTLLNLINSSTNAAGLTLTQTNPTGGTVQGEIAGTLNVAHGGTGATTAAQALTNLGAQPNLGLIQGTYANGDLCTYTASGTVLNCNTAMPTSLPPSGTAGGDLSGTYPDPTVAKVNGAAVPVSATVLGSNSAAQLIAAGTTGSGNVVLATSPTITTPTVAGGITASSSPSTSTCFNTAGSATACGASGSVTLQTNGTANSSQSLLNLINSSTNAAGLTFTETNTTGGTVQGEIAGIANAAHGGTGLNTSSSTGLPNITSGTWAVSPNIGTQGYIAGISPVCDIRAYGATMGAQDIGPYVQDCINSMSPAAPGITQTILLPCGNTYCNWASPQSLTNPNNVQYTVKLAGYLRLGSPLIPGILEGENWEGVDTPDARTQFQMRDAALIQVPDITGTVGTAVSGNAGVVITPTFTSGAIANMPPGSAITIGGTTTSTASASAAAYGTSGRIVTLTLSAEVRYLPIENLTVTGCSDSTLDITNGLIMNVDYSAAGGETVQYFQSPTTTPTTATGCSITSFDEDKYESVRVWCSNGVTMSGSIPSGLPACSTGQFTIYPAHAHAASDVWGVVGVSTWANENGHFFHNINLQNCYGMCYWGEQESNIDLDNVGLNPAQFLTAGGIEQTASWVGNLDNINFQNPASAPVNCGAGGCPQSAYPFGLRCDSESAGINLGGGNPGSTGCSDMNIVGGSFIDGSIKIDGQGLRQVNGGIQQISNILFEQAPNSAIVVDNRNTIDFSTCPRIENNALQDNVTLSTVYYLSYTDKEAPLYGCWSMGGNANSLTGDLTNKYFNDSLAVDRTPFLVATQPNTKTADMLPATTNDGRIITGTWAGGEAGLGPAELPYGSLAVTNSPATWATDCGSGCSVVTTNIVCPDGAQATSAMQCAEIDGSNTQTDPTIGTWTGATYAGDSFIYGCYVRPGVNYSIPKGDQWTNSPFYLITTGTDGFEVPGGQSGAQSYPVPAFYPNLQNLSWYASIAIATIATGESTSHNINFRISGGPGTGSTPVAGYGNQFSDCRWTYIPGPNNPSYGGVTQDRIQYAAEYQYRGAVPGSAALPAGIATTQEDIQAPAYFVAGAPAGSYIKADGTGAGTANIQITVGTAAITANTCATAATATMTGLTTSNTIKITPTTDISAVTGWSPTSTGQLYFVAWPTANTLNYHVCNSTSASITPGAATTWNVSAQ